IVVQADSDVVLVKVAAPIKCELQEDLQRLIFLCGLPGRRDVRAGEEADHRLAALPDRLLFKSKGMLATIANKVFEYRIEGLQTCRPEIDGQLVQAGARVVGTLRLPSILGDFASINVKAILKFFSPLVFDDCYMQFQPAGPNPF